MITRNEILPVILAEAAPKESGHSRYPGNRVGDQPNLPVGRYSRGLKEPPKELDSSLRWKDGKIPRLCDLSSMGPVQECLPYPPKAPWRSNKRASSVTPS